MAIYNKNKKAKFYKGFYKPVNWYHRGHKVAGWEEGIKSGESILFEDTYDDFMDIEMSGKSEQVQTVQGKNFVDISGELFKVTIGYAPGSAESKAIFADNSVVVGMSRNAFMNINVNLIYRNPTTGYVKYSSNFAWYGVGFKVYLKPSTNYIKNFTGDGYAG
ncbi:MAG: hypothetical protein WC292_00400 [Clostridia bacterium]